VPTLAPHALADVSQMLIIGSTLFNCPRDARHAGKSFINDTHIVAESFYLHRNSIAIDCFVAQIRRDFPGVHLDEGGRL
jgi:hypothetical protein